jgi:predicted nucleic acid-binding protein
MSDKYFVDSNIWLYAFMDSTSPKRTKSIQLIDKTGIILSTQVVNEVFANLLRKASYTESEIQQTIKNFQARYPILIVTIDIIRQASHLRTTYRLSYWDSVVIATAIDESCNIVYSEDMQHGLRIDCLTIINPFIT